MLIDTGHGSHASCQNIEQVIKGFLRIYLAGRPHPMESLCQIRKVIRQFWRNQAFK